MKRAVALALTAGAMFAATGAQAEWSANAGFESMKWKESSVPGVSESGMRWALGLSWAQTREAGLSAGYNLKLYNGNVDRTGAVFGVGPVSGDTHYRGMAHEVLAIYRTPKSTVDFVLAAGWDHWRRQPGPAKQTWDVLYARLGADMGAAVKQGVLGSIGVKYPVYTRENAGFSSVGFNENPRVRPGRDLSLYGSLGYRVNPQWDVIGYYDSYRFKQSNTVAVTSAAGTTLISQPESKQDVIGMKVQHNF